MKKQHEDILDPDVLIDVRNLSKCYHLYDRPQDRLLQSIFRGRKRFYREFWALKDVSLQVKRGEAIGVIGRNGAGKSTLLQLITGTLTPTSGEISVRGRVAALLQLGSGFNPEFTGRENVYLNGAILGFSRLEIKQHFDKIAAFADIGEFIEQPVKTYSSGMTMRLAFAVSVCLEPEVLIVDEALSVGDAVFQFKCRNRLEELVSKGTTLLFVSHDMGAVKSFCNRVIYLVQGKVKAEGIAEGVADLYFKDINCERKKIHSSSKGGTIATRTTLKKAPSNFSQVESIAFRFIVGKATCFNYGDNISLDIVCTITSEIKNPSIHILIQSRNLLLISGKRIFLPSSHKAERYKIRVDFPAIINTYKCFVTVKLVENINEKDNLVVHAIEEPLVFEILNQQEDSNLGYFDIGIEQNITKID